VTQAAAPHLREARGVVVMIEDVAAYQPWPSFAPHCSAKAAQAMLTRVFARALAPEVRVCGVAPGPVAVGPGQEERRAAEALLGRGADRAVRQRRQRGVRGPLPALRPAGVRPRAATARRSRPRRGRDAGDVRVGLARRLELPTGAWTGRALALRRRPERDRRP